MTLSIFTKPYFPTFTSTEQQRENDRALRKAGRDIEREKRKLEDEEKKLVQ